jgi:hypothetical protein
LELALYISEILWWSARIIVDVFMHRFLLPSALAALFAPLAPAQRGPVPGLSTATPYLIYYGDWTNARAEFARDNYRLVILHPSGANVTRVQIAIIQAGPDTIPSTADDVPVLAYISVGEDDRPGSPFVGDGEGPRVDPRASDTAPLAGIDPLGKPSPGGTGFASYYLDDGVIGDPNSVAHDGQPDRNRTFGGYYVNPGAPAWFTILKTMTKSAAGCAGFDEILTTTAGNGYGCDGLFLDTLDTPAPNIFGGTQFEWTTPAYQALVARISSTYPGKLLLGNRGLFFYNSNFKNYEFTLRPYLNLVLFESYYTDSSGSGAPTAFFDDNKFNFAPKINAEAQRADGFTMLSLGYTSAGEPPTLGDDDFFESQAEQGWPLYRTNPALDTIPFSTAADEWNALFTPDIVGPVWDSTAALGIDSDPGTPGNQPPPPRVGIQQAVADDGQVTVRWDVARDQTGPVRYNLYYTDQPTLDFATAIKVAAVQAGIPANYLVGTGPGRYPFEFTVSGLANGTPHRFAVRAEDALGNEEGNSVVLAATPAGPASDFRRIAIDGAFADWAGAPVLDADPAEGADPDFAEVSIANDADFLYIRFTLHNAFAPFTDYNSHVFIDTDNDPGTGFAVGGATIGSDFMVESFGPGVASGWDERLGGFNDGSASGTNWSINPTTSGTEFELRISRSATYDSDGAPVFDADTIRVVLHNNRGDITAPAGILYAFVTAYESWRFDHFTTAELADPLLSGDQADLEPDGVANLLEFALGLDPRIPDAQGLPSGAIVDAGPDDYLAITYTRRPPTDGVTYTLESSSDLDAWDDSPAQFVEVSTTQLPGGFEQVTVRLATPIPASPKFLRLRVELD